jgi:hypothetical protein
LPTFYSPKKGHKATTTQATVTTAPDLQFLKERAFLMLKKKKKKGRLFPIIKTADLHLAS